MTRLNNDQKITCMDLAVKALGPGDPVKTIMDVGGTIEKVYTKIVSLVEDNEESEEDDKYSELISLLLHLVINNPKLSNDARVHAGLIIDVLKKREIKNEG